MLVRIMHFPCVDTALICTNCIFGKFLFNHQFPFVLMEAMYLKLENMSAYRLQVLYEFAPKG